MQPVVTLPLLKCASCGKDAVVVYNGFSMCKRHHFSSLLEKRKGIIMNEMVNGNYKKILDEKLYSRETMERLINDYDNMFGDFQ